MLSEISSISSFSSSSSADASFTDEATARAARSMACGASTTLAESVFNSSERSFISTDTAEDLCTRLDRASGRRLDHQCASLRPPRPRQVSELGEILQRAGRLRAQRMSNQDYTPANVRRLESLERVTEMSVSDTQQQQLPAMSMARRQPQLRGMIPQQQSGRESVLFSIAARLSRMDSKHSSQDNERNVHPRDHMRRILFRSIDRLHRLGALALDSSQRPQRQPLAS
ncbi:hypothetical protein LPJ79_003582 [Coemansia sp. RSA 1821]|nr:hypothetical protein LPJ68_003204 [Coemansia sp. RSA 1086]KAJ1749598.1 hypothetical protein LPJ79_003582 [Coemansia sp. RSA 1821]